MATKKETLTEAAERDRAEVLDDADVAGDVDARVASNSNLELGAADSFVNTEKTTPAERASFANRVSPTNHTMAGMPSDVHQVLVGTSQLYRQEAMTYRDIEQVLAKYDSLDSDASVGGLSEEVRAHLVKAMKTLKPLADMDERSRVLLEKHV